MGRLRVGCSGWAYADWAGSFYPAGLPAKLRLEHYATVFDAVEINTTHYGTPAPRTVERWCEAVPEEFRFSVKLHRFGTHRKKLLDPSSWAERSLEPARQLGERAGPVLMQLPPRWLPRLDRLEATLTEFGRLGSPPVAVEVRDRRWLGRALTELLARHNATLVYHDLLEMVDRWEPTAGFAFIRLHGPDPDLPYHGSYPPAALRSMGSRIADLVTGGIHVYAFFNNDVGGSAPFDAARLSQTVDDILGVTQSR